MEDLLTKLELDCLGDAADKFFATRCDSEEAVIITDDLLNSFFFFYCILLETTSSRPNTCTVSKRVLILRTWSLIRTFLAFRVLIGSLFMFQGPSFHYFGFIHAKNVNPVSYLQALVPVYTLGKF